MQVVPGELTIITGVPNSGKSEWIDALLCNLTHQHGWSFALCSMEKKVRCLEVRLHSFCCIFIVAFHCRMATVCAIASNAGWS